MSSNPHSGQSLDCFLKEERLHEDATSYAVKRVLAWQVEKAMHEQDIAKAKMATRMITSCTPLETLLDPNNDKVYLDTVQGSAAALGHRLRLVLV
jgi:hypothetical protein